MTANTSLGLAKSTLRGSSRRRSLHACTVLLLLLRMKKTQQKAHAFFFVMICFSFFMFRKNEHQGMSREVGGVLLTHPSSSCQKLTVMDCAGGGWR